MRSKLTIPGSHNPIVAMFLFVLILGQGEMARCQWQVHN